MCPPMKKILLPILLLPLVLKTSDVDGAKILGLFGHEGKSHFDVFEPLLKELVKRGHELTVVSFFPQKEPLANYTDISLKGVLPILLNSVPFDVFEKYKSFFWLYPYVNYYQLSRMGLETCEAVLASNQIQNLIETKEKYDLIITEMFNTDCLLSIVYKLQAPFIGLSSCSLMPWFNRQFGSPNNPSFVPNIFYGKSHRMTFPERLHNAFLDTLTERLYHPLFTIPAENLVRKYIGEDIPPLEDIAKTASLLLLNTHFTLHHPKPLATSIIEVGGLHIAPAKKLPQDIEKFINESEHGVILFSLGSMLKAKTLPEGRRKAFLDAFAEIPQRVIWKFEEDLSGVPDNVKIYHWIPQRDILEHPNVKAFIAHGGLLGLTEAIYCGKPVMGIPMFGDQFLNIRAAVEIGLAVELPFTEIFKETVLSGIKKITSKEYNDRAQALSQQYRDRLVPPMEAAVYWTEYVIKYKGAPQLRSAAVDLQDYQYYLIDVVLVAVILLLALLFILHSVSKFIVRKVRNAFTSSKKIKSS